MKEQLTMLQNMKYDLFDNYRISFTEKFEIAGKFMEDQLQDVIDAIDAGIDEMKEMNERIKELEDHIQELGESA